MWGVRVRVVEMMLANYSYGMLGPIKITGQDFNSYCKFLIVMMCINISAGHWKNSHKSTWTSINSVIIRLINWSSIVLSKRNMLKWLDCGSSHWLKLKHITKLIIWLKTLINNLSGCIWYYTWMTCSTISNQLAEVSNLTLVPQCVFQGLHWKWLIN